MVIVVFSFTQWAQEAIRRADKTEAESTVWSEYSGVNTTQQFDICKLCSVNVDAHFRQIVANIINIRVFASKIVWKIRKIVLCSFYLWKSSRDGFKMSKQGWKPLFVNAYFKLCLHISSKDKKVPFAKWDKVLTWYNSEDSHRLATGVLH